MCCTDSQHSRLALSDLALRYLVPSIDCGAMLEGKNGTVTGQILQLVRMLPEDPCALCRGMIDASIIAQELMPEEERARRRGELERAALLGEDGGPYWRAMPQINTVGYLTTVSGALAAGYVIGWLTGRFSAPFERLQLNLVAPEFDVVDQKQKPRPGCVCRTARGRADQGAADAMISAPAHWQRVRSV